ncbi:sigma-70 family RNA polymerase sigma factor [Bordetella genomosp. 10]|uniref:sigma-70 family RNA polymerase sigma factor n=1 Tax=Bordetella genomosp. 10 TaxID=1416804 RepID=UPI00211AEF4B|nr:sigma-70 family RNA polymerase sigma factor [Bordetella genomosp. 10]
MSETPRLSRQAVGTLYIDNRGWLQGWLRGKLGDAHLAADFVHDTFVRLLARPRTTQELREPRAFLRTVASGLLIDHWRRQDLERAWLQAWEGLPEDTHPSAETQAMLLQTLQTVDAMLARLGERTREAFLLQQVHGCSQGEIAQRLGVSDRMVRKYLSAAMLGCLQISMAGA